jgi:hypothetical protein
MGVKPVTDRSSWAEKPNGIIDWERVFEDPEMGLITLVAQAHSPSALRKIAQLIVQSLYVRTDDPAELARLMAEIAALIPDDPAPQAFPHIVAEVTAFLRRLKETRIRKAIKLEREQARGKKLKGKLLKTATAETSKNLRREEERRAERRRKRVRLVGAVVAVAAIAAAAGFAYTVRVSPSLEKLLEPNRLLVQQMTEALESGKTDERNSFGGRLELSEVAGHQAVTADGIPHDACMSVAWVLLNRGFIIINGMTAKKYGPAVLKELCAHSAGPAAITWIPKDQE